MKIAELKNKSQAELLELLQQSKVKLGQLNFERVRKNLSKSSDIKKTKKVIAQINTLITQL